jgi:hypothetical protein
MNLRELLVAAKHVIPRPPEHAWMEERVEQGAQMLLSGQDYWDEVRPVALTWAQAQGHGPRSVPARWMLRDLIDRYRLRAAAVEPVFY